MKVLRAWLRRALDLLRRRRRERELAEELDSHLALHIADNLRAGMTSQEARRQAILALGGIESTKEAYREQRGLPWLETTAQDVRYALRGLRRSPGFAVTAVVTLALGIGATTAIFSAVYALLIRPLPYQDPSRLVFVTNSVPRLMFGTAVPLPEVVHWRQSGRPFEAVAGYIIGGGPGGSAFDMTLNFSGEATLIPVAEVTSNFLHVLGITPRLGRDFARGEDNAVGAKVALLTDSMWRERFHANPNVIGTAINLDGQSYTIIGVLPQSFRFPEPLASPDVFLPLKGGADALYVPDQGVMFVRAIARLSMHATFQQTGSDLQGIQQSRTHDYPPFLQSMMRDARIDIVPLQRHLTGDVRLPLLILLAAVGFVLLIACANIANLQLLRATGRRHELAVRGALGATRPRLAGQLFVESCVLCAFASALAWLLANVALRLIREMNLASLPWLSGVSLSPVVFLFMIVVAAVSTLVFGCAPSISGSRTNLTDALKAASLRLAGAREYGTLRQGFLQVEIALALMLLVSAGLLIRSFRQLMRVDPGFNSHGVLIAHIATPTYRFTPAQAEARISWFAKFTEILLPRLQALPGVRYAAFTTSLPLHEAYGVSSGIRTPDMPPVDPRGFRPPTVPRIAISADYFRAMGTPLVAGREFTDADNENSPAVAIVNQSFATQFFHGAAVGHHFQSLTSLHCKGCVWGRISGVEIVGLAADMRHDALTKPARPEWFVPIRQTAGSNFTIVLATDSSAQPLASPVREAVKAIEPDAPVFGVSTMERLMDESLAQRRLTMFLLSAFAALALLLAAIGVYGVISYAVVQRTQEIGIRVALGATRAGVLRLVVGQQARMVILGGVVGLALAWAAGGVLSSLLYGVTAHDAATFVISWVALTLVALLASAAPALRATRTDPCEALRYE